MTPACAPERGTARARSRGCDQGRARAAGGARRASGKETHDVARGVVVVGVTGGSVLLAGPGRHLAGWAEADGKEGERGRGKGGERGPVWRERWRGVVGCCEWGARARKRGHRDARAAEELEQGRRARGETGAGARTRRREAKGEGRKGAGQGTKGAQLAALASETERPPSRGLYPLLDALSRGSLTRTWEGGKTTVVFVRRMTPLALSLAPLGASIPPPSSTRTGVLQALRAFWSAS